MDATTVQTWWEILGHLPLGDALNALLIHRRESTEYVQPAHIIKLVARVRRERRIEEARNRPAITASPRTAPPPDFRAQIAAATHRLGELTSSFGKMPVG